MLNGYPPEYAACTRECSLVAVVAGTKSEDVIAVLQRIDEESRYAVKEEVTLDLSDSMRKIVRTAFPEASRFSSLALLSCSPNSTILNLLLS